MPNVGLAFDGRQSGATLVDHARTAERAGAGSLWIANHLFQRDPFSAAEAALAATTGPRVALMSVSPYTVHPVQAAMAAATLDERHPGRVVLCFGVGVPRELAAAGLEPRRPIQTLREALELTRALLGGDRVDYEGEVFRVSGRALPTGARRVPLILAASGPRMLALAGMVADGVLISAGSSTRFTRWALDEVERAARGRRVERLALVYTALAEDEGAALDRLRRTLAVTLRGDHQRRNLEITGSVVDQAALTRAVAADDWAAMRGLLADEVVRRHAAGGRPDQVRSRIVEYRAAGLDEVVLAGLHDPAGIAQALRLA